jgi:hypothetical protein
VEARLVRAVAHVDALPMGVPVLEDPLELMLKAPEELDKLAV